MESPTLMPTVNQAETIQDIPLSRTTEQLRTAQTLWAAMFQTSEANVTISDGHHPIILSRENQKDNAAWADSLTEKQDTITRVYGMNVNGLSLDKRGGQLDVLCKVIKEVQADVFCGQEHNLASETTQVRQITYNTVRQHWKRSRITFGTTPILFPKQYKPGGTFMITAGDLTGRVIAQTQDKWGRWVTQTYQGRGGTKITIYSAYQVVSKDIKIGSITTASQQQSLLMQTQDRLTNPRSAFRRDLNIAIQNSIASGQEILLLGDFNEPFGTKKNQTSILRAAASFLHKRSTHTTEHTSLEKHVQYPFSLLHCNPYRWGTKYVRIDRTPAMAVFLTRFILSLKTGAFTVSQFCVTQVGRCS
jgi:exonuclease III